MLYFYNIFLLKLSMQLLLHANDFVPDPRTVPVAKWDTFRQTGEEWAHCIKRRSSAKRAAIFCSLSWH